MPAKRSRAYGPLTRVRWHTQESGGGRTSRTGPHSADSYTNGCHPLAPRAADTQVIDIASPPFYATSCVSQRRKFSPVFMFTPLITPLHLSPHPHSSPRLPSPSRPFVCPLVCPVHPAFLDFLAAFFFATHPIFSRVSSAPAFASFLAIISGLLTYRALLYLRGITFVIKLLIA